MKKFFWSIIIFFSCLFFSQRVLAVSYDIESYKGNLQIHPDNTATFVETVTSISQVATEDKSLLWGHLVKFLWDLMWKESRRF